MSVIRVGSNGTYAEGWDQIFGGASAKKAGKKRATVRGGSAPKKAKTPTKAKKAATSKPKKAVGRKKAGKRR